ncbi:hypothetical protein ACWCQ1_17580 [Streptomyces sp. NPDC002144]
MPDLVEAVLEHVDRGVEARLVDVDGDVRLAKRDEGGLHLADGGHDRALVVEVDPDVQVGQLGIRLPANPAGLVYDLTAGRVEGDPVLVRAGLVLAYSLGDLAGHAVEVELRVEADLAGVGGLVVLVDRPDRFKDILAGAARVRLRANGDRDVVLNLLELFLQVILEAGGVRHDLYRYAADNIRIRHRLTSAGSVCRFRRRSAASWPSFPGPSLAAVSGRTESWGPCSCPTGRSPWCSG